MLDTYLKKRCVPKRFWKAFERKGHKLWFYPRRAHLCHNCDTRILHRMPPYCAVVNDCMPKYQTFGQRVGIGHIGHVTWITEGIFDMLSALNHTSAITFLGIPPRKLIADHQWREVVLALDNDSTGILGTFKIIPLLLEAGAWPITIAQLETENKSYKDLNEYLCDKHKLPETIPIQYFIEDHLEPQYYDAIGDLVLALADKGFTL